MRNCACVTVVPLQVLSAGPLGILGRNGWFCLEQEVEVSPELAGWRGLLSPNVRSHFNNTFFAYGAVGDTDWGPVDSLMANLGLDYHIVRMESRANQILQERLASRLPTFFYLWEPHPFHKRFNLNRIQLPVYRTALYDEGWTDYPTSILIKAVSPALQALAPKVFQLVSRFVIDRDAQETMLEMVFQGVSTMDAACAWMRNENNTATWQLWKPDDGCEPGRFSVQKVAACSLAEKVNASSPSCVQCKRQCAGDVRCAAKCFLDAEPTCAECGKGSASAGGLVTECTNCQPGTRMRC